MSHTTDGDRLRIDPERYAPRLAVAGSVGLVLGVALWNVVGVFLVVFGLTFLFLACWSRSDGLLLFGPFVRVELTRLSRRQRVHLWRTLILTVFMSAPILVLYYLIAGPVPEHERIPRNTARMAAEGVFLFSFFYLFLVVTSVTATFLSTAVADDREAKRLDFVLVTDLRNREVVIGKAAARAVGAFGYFLPVLPLLMIYPALFDLHPGFIVCSVGYAGVTIFSFAGLAVLGSVMSKTKKLAGQFQFKFIMLYFILGWALNQLRNFPAIWFFPGSPSNVPPYAVSDVVELLNVGNPIQLVSAWMGTAFTGLTLTPVLRAFPGYAAFHIGVGLLTLLLAVRLLRRKSAELAGEAPPPAAVEAAAKRKPVSDYPVIWKEMYAVPAQLVTKGGRVQAALIGFVIVVVPAVVFLAAAVSDLFGLAETVRMAARFVLPFVAWVATAVAMTTASATIAKERERDTLTVPQLTDLSPVELLRQKFLGILGANRGLVYWQLIVGIPAVLNGAYTWWAFLGLLVTQVVLTTAAVAIGLVASAKAATAEKAARWVAFAICGLVGGSALAAVFLMVAAGGAGGFPMYVLVGLVPPATLLAFGFAHFSPPGTLVYWASGVAIGWGFYMLVTWLLWRWARHRFLAACQQVKESGGEGEGLRPVAEDRPAGV